MKKNKIMRSGVVLAGLLTATTLSTSGWAASLEEAMLAAYENNPTLLAQRANLRATDETVAQAASGWRPTVIGSGSLGAISSEVDSGTTTNSDRSFYSASLSVTQNLYSGGATEAGVDAADANVRAARARLEEVEQSVLYQTAISYLDVLRDVAVLELNQQNEVRLVKQLEATQDRFEVGEVTRTDVAQAESRLSRARAETIAAAGVLETSKAAYAQVVGEEIEGNVNAPALNLALPASRDEAVSLSSENNPAVIAAQFDHEAANLAVKVQYGSLKPSVDLVGAAGYSDDLNADDTTVTDASIRVNVTVPIYQAGLVSSQIRQAKETASATRIQIDEARRTIVEAATSSWENLKTTRAQIQAQQDEVRASEIAFEGVEQEAIVGSRTVLDVLDAEQALLDARVNLVRTQRDENVAQFTLLQAIGGLNMRDLGLGAEIYNEEAYYNSVKDLWYGEGEGQ